MSETLTGMLALLTEIRHFRSKQEFEAYQAGLLDCADALKRLWNEPGSMTDFVMTGASEANGWEVTISRREVPVTFVGDVGTGRLLTNAIAGDSGQRGVR